MGIEDRDYYREDYAKKNGMRYDAKTATYRRPFAPRAVFRRASRSSWAPFVFKVLAIVCLACTAVFAKRAGLL